MKILQTICLILPVQCCSLAQSVFPVRDKGEAPNRTYHVVHYKIEVSFDEPKKMVMGKVTTTLVPFQSDCRTIAFDAEEMNIAHVRLASGTELRFDTLQKKLTIQLNRSYSTRDTIVLTTEYSCVPKKGLYFTQPDSGYPDKPSQIWSQGEDMDNHFWFPCYDFPNDRATSEVIATVRSSYVALSNGKLVSVKEDAKNHTKTFHWSESKPHVSYLITLAAGNYAILKDRVGKLPLEYYVYPNDTVNARECFKHTPDMIRFFNEKIGFPYAWEKYAQVLIADFIEGGMENTSATSLLEYATVYDARVRVDNSPIGFIGHELAHQWWGDLVTCKDWRHLWLNESFASYFDPLYQEHLLGRDDFDFQMSGNQQAGISSDTTTGRKPIVSVGSYGTNVYPRGASVLHMLRFILGDEMFWRAINHYVTKNQYRCVETNDLKIAIEEATGQNLYWFFDEWVYKAGHPIFNVSYRWSDSARAVLLSVKQTQTMDSLTGLFRTPADVEITSPSESLVHRVNIMTGDTTFVIPSQDKPKLVIFDKGNWLIKQLKFEKSDEEWNYQAEFASNPVDRIRAVRELANRKSNEPFVPTFANLALHDRFWAVRREAITSFGKVKATSDSLKETIRRTLVAAYRDVKSTVRNAAIAQLGTYRGAEVVNQLHAALDDSSYTVVSSALRSLTKADSSNAAATLTRYLNVPSWRNGVSNTALSMLATLDSSKAVTLALEDAGYGNPVPTRFVALAILSKYGKKKPEVLSFYGKLLSDKNSGVKSTAVKTLGDIGDESAIPALQRVADDKGDADAGNALSSIEKIKKKHAGKD